MEPESLEENNLLNLQPPEQVFSNLKQADVEQQFATNKQKEDSDTFFEEQRLLNHFCNEVFLIESRAITKLREQLQNSENQTLKRSIQQKLVQEEQAAQKRLRTQMIYEKMQSESRLKQRLHLEEKKALDRLQEALLKEKQIAAKRYSAKLKNDSEEMSRVVKARLSKQKQQLEAELAEYREYLEMKYQGFRAETADKLSSLEFDEARNIRNHFEQAKQKLQAEFENRKKLIFKAEEARQIDQAKSESMSLDRIRAEFEEALQSQLESQMKGIKQKLAQELNTAKVLLLRTCQRKYKKYQQYKKSVKVHERSQKLRKSLQERSGVAPGQAIAQSQPQSAVPLNPRQPKAPTANHRQTQSQTGALRNVAQRPARSTPPPPTADSQDSQDSLQLQSARQQLTRKLLLAEPNRVRQAAQQLNDSQIQIVLAHCDGYSRRNISACLPKRYNINSQLVLNSNGAATLIMKFADCL